MFNVNPINCHAIQSFWLLEMFLFVKHLGIYNVHVNNCGRTKRSLGHEEEL